MSKSHGFYSKSGGRATFADGVITTGDCGATRPVRSSETVLQEGVAFRQTSDRQKRIRGELS
jgi:hypothetical protein